ncbi:MAG: RNA polymerase sigma factor SigZ [Burkholderiales bacterium]
MAAPCCHPSTEAVWRSHQLALRRFIHKRVADSFAAEDILQDVFEKVHASLHTLQQPELLPGWLFRIARNAIVDYYRRARPGASLPEDLAGEGPATGDALFMELAECVQPFIDALPADYRDALILADIRQLPQAEVAKRLGLSLSGAKSRIQRGRSKLKALLLDCCRFEPAADGGIAGFEQKHRGSCR